MSDCGKKIRLNRVLGGSERRALVVAFDHALVLGPIPGTEDPLGKIRQFAQAEVDALLLNLGLIRQFANSTTLGPLPAIIARLDWTTVWSALGQGGSGALHSALEPFARRGIDLLKIEGRPVKGRPWEYCFYLDLRGSPNDSEVTSALSELRDRRMETRILGAYRSAEVPAG